MLKMEIEIKKNFNGYELKVIKSEFDSPIDYFNVHTIAVKLNNLVCELNEDLKEFNKQLKMIQEDK